MVKLVNLVISLTSGQGGKVFKKVMLFLGKSQLKVSFILNHDTFAIIHFGFQFLQTLQLSSVWYFHSVPSFLHLFFIVCQCEYSSKKFSWTVRIV